MIKCKHAETIAIGYLSANFAENPHEERRRWCRACGSLYDHTWTTRGRFSYRPRWTRPKGSAS